MNNTSGLSVVAYPLLGTYNISKAALAMLSGTLRLELEPFGVQVVDLKAGGVQINFFPNQEGGHYPTLPKGSLYKVAEKEVEHEWSDAGARKDG
ncbi:uncharacterized protein E0L32_004638 [Thyridium curvatum]|uniref:Uncharacterized protein n=1 Tax=Thyridium curvatum TaxID=1093900 RepID=A0A507BEI2_9PEZI|nr:uncharacterized protein E0L32_004638 [Thyridium curvatum]TPX15361.1 hypothetical protein E0L32_004638 [Thyridium curvatum]